MLTYKKYIEKFKKKYMKETTSNQRSEQCWDLTREGPKYQNVLSYTYGLKIMVENDELRFERNRDRIMELFEDEYRQRYDWAVLHLEYSGRLLRSKRSKA